MRGVEEDARDGDGSGMGRDVPEAPPVVSFFLGAR